MRPYMIIGIVGLVLLAVFFWLRPAPSHFDWKETYDKNSQEPYGTYIVHRLLKSYFAGEQHSTLKDSLNNELPQDNESANYVFIGEALYLDSADTKALLNFVEEGNTAFIASKTLPYTLSDSLHFEECTQTWYYHWEDYDTMSDTLANFNFEHPDLATADGFNYRFFEKDKVKTYSWHHIPDYYFCTTSDTLIALGNIQTDTFWQAINFARLTHGNGYFYFHTNPLAFSNFYMAEKEGIAYANKVFSHLPKGKIYWDAVSGVSEEVGRQQNQSAEQDPFKRLSEKSPLQYILSQPPLAWAWYLTIALGLMYLIFQAKRKQQVIPVLEQNTNTSLEFIRTIGRLSFMQSNHKKLALQKMRLLLSYIRERYHFQLKPEDQAFAPRLATKSEVPEEVIQTILKYHQNIKTSSFTSENTLIEFHKVMEFFYKNCK